MIFLHPWYKKIRRYLALSCHDVYTLGLVWDLCLLGASFHSAGWIMSQPLDLAVIFPLMGLAWGVMIWSPYRRVVHCNTGRDLFGVVRQTLWIYGIWLGYEAMTAALPWTIHFRMVQGLIVTWYWILWRFLYGHIKTKGVIQHRPRWLWMGTSGHSLTRLEAAIYQGKGRCMGLVTTRPYRRLPDALSHIPILHTGPPTDDLFQSLTYRFSLPQEIILGDLSLRPTHFVPRCAWRYAWDEGNVFEPLWLQRILGIRPVALKHTPIKPSLTPLCMVVASHRILAQTFCTLWPRTQVIRVSERFSPKECSSLTLPGTLEHITLMEKYVTQHQPQMLFYDALPDASFTTPLKHLLHLAHTHRIPWVGCIIPQIHAPAYAAMIRTLGPLFPTLVLLTADEVLDDPQGLLAHLGHSIRTSSSVAPLKQGIRPYTFIPKHTILRHWFTAWKQAQSPHTPVHSGGYWDLKASVSLPLEPLHRHLREVLGHPLSKKHETYSYPLPPRPAMTYTSVWVPFSPPL